MSEQNVSREINDTEAFCERVSHLSEILGVPPNLVELAVKRYPYDEKFTTYCRQDEEVVYLISKIKEEGRNFMSSIKPGKTAEDHIRKWVLDYTGELTEAEVKLIKTYWLVLSEKTAENA